MQWMSSRDLTGSLPCAHSPQQRAPSAVFHLIPVCLRLQSDLVQERTKYQRYVNQKRDALRDMQDEVRKREQINANPFFRVNFSIDPW